MERPRQPRATSAFLVEAQVLALRAALAGQAAETRLRTLLSR